MDALSHARVSTSDHYLNGKVLQIAPSTLEKLPQNIQSQQSEDKEIFYIINFIVNKELPEDTKEAQKMIRKDTL